MECKCFGFSLDGEPVFFGISDLIGSGFEKIEYSLNSYRFSEDLKTGEFSIRDTEWFSNKRYAVVSIIGITKINDFQSIRIDIPRVQIEKWGLVKINCYPLLFQENNEQYYCKSYFVV